MLDVAALVAALTLVRPDSAATIYSGRAQQLAVRPPRIEFQPLIDGRLDEPAWSQAAILTGFSQFSPSDGVASADSTEVLVWYSPTAIYFGIRAFERHGAVHATLADRDKIDADDNVQILLGPFHDQRQALLFGVNPLGAQMDGTIFEAGQSLSTGWSGAMASRVPPDLSQDFVFTSKGRVTDYGYEVEIRIPFKSVKLQPNDPQTWDINVIRQVQHSRYEDSWAPASRAKPSFLAQGGTLEGLRDLRRGLVLDVNPVVTQKVLGAPGPSGWDYRRQDAQFGGDVRWGITNNLTLNGTAHPDFAEVESDAGQFVIDPRNALFFPEKRPFFLDGIEHFQVPANLIYTRRIGEPLAATKLTGKSAGTAIGLISAVDDPGPSSPGQGYAYFNILRAQRDVSGQSRVGFLYTDRIRGSDYNRVGGVDGRAVFGPYSVALQLVGSLLRQGPAMRDGSLWSGTFSKSGKSFGLRYAVSGIDPDFRTLSGFITRAGIARANVDHHWTWFGDRGARLESFTLALVWDNTWQYDKFVRRGDAQDKKYHLRTSTTLRGGWVVGASVFWETFGFDEPLYSGYQIERPLGPGFDTVAFTGTPRIPNRDYVITLNTPQFSRVSGNLLYVWGQDENFFEWAQADIHFLSAALSLRPTAQLRIDGTYDYNDYVRRTDGSFAGRNFIPRVKVEYQIARSMFVRAVGEYDAAEHPDLRDETRTFFPLIIDGVKALAERSASFRGDYLFSFRPNPGTVLFAGYGSEARADPDPTDRFKYQRLVRDADHVFVKMSYLWRF